MRHLCLVMPFLVMLSVAAAEENWPEFRGPRGDGTSDATNLPVEFSETKNVAWKTPIKGKAWSSPVIWGRQIWLTSATEDGKELYALCVDRDSGKILRDMTVFRIAEPAYCHPFNSYASCTPVIEDGRVYVHYGSAGTAAIDTSTGKLLWTRQDLPCDHFRGPGSSPILSGELLIVCYDGVDQQYLVAFDKHTGKTVWKRDRTIDYEARNVKDGDHKKAYSTPVVIEVNGQPQLISSAAVATFAYDPATGEELWRVYHGGMNTSVRPLYSQGLLILNTAAGGDKLLAVRPDGRGDVTDTHIAWKYGQAVATRPSQVIVGDLLYMVSDNGVASCLEVKTAKTVWQHRLGGDYSASPLYADGKIYFFSQQGKIPVIEPGREFKLLATNELKDGFMASPAVADNALFPRTTAALYRLQK